MLEGMKVSKYRVQMITVILNRDLGFSSINHLEDTIYWILNFKLYSIVIKLMRIYMLVSNITN